MSIITIRDELVHYEVLGRGKPLMFLHGWVGSWRYWIPAMQAASISFRTYAVDLWGFGDTAKNPSLYHLEQQVELIDGFLMEMGIGKIAMIGHGLGGIIALQYAQQFPRLVDRVMVISLPGSKNGINPRLETATPAELVDWLLGRTPVTEAARAEAPKADPRAIQFSFEDIETLDLNGLPVNLSKPCLMVYGQNDPAVELPSQEKSMLLPEHIHQVFFDGSGHFPMLDEGNKFNRLMADFLSLTSGTSPRQLQLKEEWKRRVR